MPPLRQSPSLFRPHGRVSGRIDGDIVRYEAEGPFNEELIALLAAIEAELYAPLRQRETPTATLVVVLGSALMSPATFKSFVAHEIELRQQGIGTAITAFVIGDEVEGSRLMARNFTEAYAAIGKPFRIFSRTEDAEIWLVEQLASLPPS